jgi:hypothetical protein
MTKELRYMLKKCLVCGREFYIKNKQGRSNKFKVNHFRMSSAVTCSRECSKAHLHRRYKRTRRVL